VLDGGIVDRAILVEGSDWGRSKTGQVHLGCFLNFRHGSHCEELVLLVGCVEEVV
jgi:hypothetical protein